MYSKMTFDTPIGTLTGIASVKGLKALSVHPVDDEPWTTDHLKTLKKTRTWLDGYFSKQFHQLPVVPLDLQATPFTLSVWQALQSIPVGEISTYGALAKQVGHPKAAQATGQALKSNPILIIVPCHRVIGQNKQLTGFNAGIERKAWLLEHENINSALNTPTSIQLSLT